MTTSVSAASGSALSPAQCGQFARDGFLVVRGLASAVRVAGMRRVVLDHLARVVAPIEYEADVAYSGAPISRSATGGQTARRLMHAYDRDRLLADWAHDARLTTIVAGLLKSPALYLTRCHHNCVMTKQPAFSSATDWHRDLRYWSFQRPDLINAWLALDRETPARGCMRLIPGSHRLAVGRDRLDAAQFLRADSMVNRQLIDTAVTAELAAGDVLLFHAGVFHAAGRNETESRKLSVVYTYHGVDNAPIPGSRSARLAPVAIEQRSAHA